MKPYGLPANDFEEILTCFRQLPSISQVTLYGSRALGTQRTGSDIDLTLHGTGLTLSDTVYPLTQLLDDLNLPYTFDISIHEHIENDSLLNHIERVGIPLYEKTSGDPSSAPSPADH